MAFASAGDGLQREVGTWNECPTPAVSSQADLPPLSLVLPHFSYVGHKLCHIYSSVGHTEP